jgi:maleate cis-trans isomerase
MFGPRGDREQVAAIEAATGIPASTTSTGVLAALAALGARRIAAAAPYLAEVSDKIPDFLAANGIETLSMRTLGLAHEREISRASKEVVYRLAREAMTEGAQALFVSCTDFFPIDLIEPIERDLGVPVVTANQATMWHALRCAGIRDGMPGFGRLMALDLPDAAKKAPRTR